MKFDYKRKYKVGDIIYPFYNGTLGFFKTNIWSVVEKVDKENHWKKLRHWYNSESAELHSMILKLKRRGNKK